ncbi:MAG: tetratricopeptide repeat protein, partial [Proteobacteria bacterium]|nr:tetratricopeptide repeat protein [Pseudomonadota bacterium]
MLAPTKLWRSVTAALRSRRPRPRPRIALFLVLPVLPVLLAACVANPTAIGVGPGQAVPPGGESAALVRVADSMRDAGDVAGAIPFYRRAHQLDTLQATPLIRLAVALHTVRAYDEASRTWRSALKLDPDNADARRGYGYSLIALNKPQLAIDQLRTSNEIEEDVRSYNGLGVAYDMIGDTRGAQMHYRMGLQVAPDNVTLLNNLGLSLALSGDFPDSINLLLRVVASAVATARHRQNLALAYGLSGRLEEAAAVARQDLDEAAVANNLAYHAILRAET